MFVMIYRFQIRYCGKQSTSCSATLSRRRRGEVARRHCWIRGAFQTGRPSAARHCAHPGRVAFRAVRIHPPADGRGDGRRASGDQRQIQRHAGCLHGGFELLDHHDRTGGGEQRNCPGGNTWRCAFDPGAFLGAIEGRRPRAGHRAPRRPRDSRDARLTGAIRLTVRTDLAVRASLHTSGALSVT